MDAITMAGVLFASAFQTKEDPAMREQDGAETKNDAHANHNTFNRAACELFAASVEGRQ